MIHFWAPGLESNYNNGKLWRPDTEKSAVFQALKEAPDYAFLLWNVLAQWSPK